MEMQKEQVVSDILQCNTTVNKKDVERIYKMAQARMPTVADLNNIEAKNITPSSSSSEESP